MNIQGLIERYEKFKANQKKMTSVDLVLRDLRSLDEPEPLPFKLKDVVGRIRGFDPTTQARWINDILKELGDDYGSMKYREGYEQGKREGAWVGNQLKDADKIRQELNKPVIPQFVAEYIKKAKRNGLDLQDAMNSISGEEDKKLQKWFYHECNQEPFALAWILGYTVEKEKLYQVRLKKIAERMGYLNRLKGTSEFMISYPEENNLYATKFTRKELEEAGFGEVFNSPLFEVEEVE